MGIGAGIGMANFTFDDADASGVGWIFATTVALTRFGKAIASSSAHPIWKL